MNKRDIKFRVWNKAWNAWVTPHQDRFRDQPWRMISFSGEILYGGDPTVGPYVAKDQEDYIIQQWTGLMDKYGKEIYEGDFVKFDWERYEHDIEHDVGEVYFENGMFLFGRETEFSVNDGNFLTKTLEVVGNVFDTKKIIIP